ncbi:MAG TPA: hypothetical protein VHZ55_03955 [Bryobacteraceae bacterium]|nr:hypothetical protein [Bryobacteraceae bacterium]
MVLPGAADLRGVVWADDGAGWFVSVDTTVGSRLLYVYPDATTIRSGDIQGWAVPSRDGRHVAFLDGPLRPMPGSWNAAELRLPSAIKQH